MGGQRYLKKEYLLVGIAAIVFAVSYQLAFKKTILAWQINRQLHRQLEQSDNISIQPAYLGRKDRNLRKIIQSYKGDSVAFRNNIISRLAQMAEKRGVKLSEVPGGILAGLPSGVVSQKLKFEGDYFGLLHLVADLERTPGIGVVRSLEFRAPKDQNNVQQQKKVDLYVFFVYLNN